MASLTIPVVREIEAIYGLEGAAEATHRYQKLTAAFKQAYGEAPAVYARAPGRVNLIGEHIDYEGYGVLPMAIKQDTIVAIRKGGEKLVVGNLESDKYPTIEFSTDPNQEVNTGKHTWANYFLAAYKGVFEYLHSKGIKAPEPVGLQVMVHGVVPLGGGLSSSAAIVCSSALAVCAALDLTSHLTKGAVSEFTCTAERYVGVTSGGMDQAISVMGMPGLALLVEFNPVRAADVQLPEGATFVVANSLTVSKKAETADRRYNLRVVECRLAAMLLAVALGNPPSEAVSITTLKEVEPLIIEKYGPGAEAQDKAVREHLHEGVYMPEEIEGLLGKKLDSIYAGNASALRVLSVVGPEGFELRNRALHVYSEAGRVYAFRDVCKGDASNDEKLQQLGELLNASHTSCSQLYQCSCEELDTLVGVARAAGALGARLTGAGWGGCIVALVPQAQVPAFQQQLREQYYGPPLRKGSITEQDLRMCVFASSPSAGAAVKRLGSKQTCPQPGAAAEEPALAGATTLRNADTV